MSQSASNRVDAHLYVIQRSGFSLTELLVTIAIMAIIAGVTIPQYLKSQKYNNLKSSVGELESLIKEARNFSLTGLESATVSDQLPTGGYGVYLSVDSNVINSPYINDRALTFIDDDPTQDYFIDSGEISNSALYLNHITTYELFNFDGTDCTPLDDVSILFQPPRADAIMKGNETGGGLIDLDTLILRLSIDNSSAVVDQHVLEVVNATGKVESDPNSPPC